MRPNANSLFHSRLKTFLFCKSFSPYPSFSSSELTPRTVYRYFWAYPFLLFSSFFPLFTARCYASAVLAMGLCLCSSVSVRSWCSMETAERIELVLACDTIVYRTDRQVLSTARFCHTGQLATADTCFKTCRTSSFCTVAWQLARFQLTRRIARSLGYSWACC